MAYNMSFMDNATNPVDLIVGIGAATGADYLIGYMTLVTFFIVFLMITKIRWDTGGLLEVLAIDGFLTTILTILFYVGGMVPVSTILYPSLVFFIALLSYMLKK